MHDRRIDGKPHVFGNYGALYMNAMTWYDHETQSFWSQPTGTSLRGEYKGVRLEMIPSAVMPWGTWRREHPDTLLLDSLVSPGARAYVPFNGQRGEYVVGVALGNHAKAYPFDLVSQQVVTNDRIGELPLVVYANPDDGSVHVYAGVIGGRELQFEWVQGQLKDRETGTRWDPTNGFALEGPLQGRLLRAIPTSTAYDWAWIDFYPHSTLYAP